MKIAVVFIVVVVTVISDAQKEKCAGFCFSSKDCSVAAGHTQCRCIFLQCKWIEGNCGGGCVTDAQCRQWSEGDETCMCKIGECQRESQRLKREQMTFEQ